MATSDDRGPNRIVYDLSEVKLHAPWPERRIACVGGNYAAHTEEAKKAGQWGFWKVPAEVAGPNDAIPFPKRVTYF